jgi:hypothetical protein
MLTIYLRERTTFFQDHITKESNLLEKAEWDVFVGALLLRHMGQLVSNGHAIVDFRQNIFTTESLKLMLLKKQANGGGLHLLLKSQRVFTGIFPRISMLNHSCSPNIRNKFDGKVLTIFAASKIEKGGEIFNCYGPNYRLMSYQERQDSLRLQYNFNCKCTKCSEKADEYVRSPARIRIVSFHFVAFRDSTTQSSAASATNGCSTQTKSSPTTTPKNKMIATTTFSSASTAIGCMKTKP